VVLRPAWEGPLATPRGHPQRRHGRATINTASEGLVDAVMPEDPSGMTTPRVQLPEDLRSGAFTVAHARGRGVTPKRLRGRDLLAPTRGVRQGGGGAVELSTHARAFALALPPDGAFSHLTAARLLGLPTPTPWPGRDEPLDVMRAKGRPRVSRAGCVAHRGLETRRVTEVDGLRVVSALDTWGDLAGIWAPDHLLAAADVLVRRGLSTPLELLAWAEQRRGRRHVDDLRTVARLARAGAASPAESRARYVFWSWGLPEPELNVPVLGHDGGWLATSDFLWRAQRVVGEYDGDVHRTDRRTWHKDRERRAALEDAGYRYVEMTDSTFRQAHHREALRLRLGRLLF
jgi:hypothetical protein